MTGLKLLGLTGLLFSGMGLAAETIPGIVPDDFKSWPATAILGFVAVLSLAVLIFTLNKLFKSAEIHAKTAMETAQAIGRMNEQEETRTRNVNEMCAKWNTTNERLGSLVKVLSVRPCLVDNSSKSKQKSQQIDL